MGQLKKNMHCKISKINIDGGIESLVVWLVALRRVSDPSRGQQEVGNNASVLALISVAGEKKPPLNFLLHSTSIAFLGKD